MAKIIVDDQEYDVPDGNNLLQACLSLGLDLPYFCWHPSMGSVGACRQCAVIQYRDENDTQGRIVMSCMTPANEGVRISIKDKQSTDFRAGIIELLMTNHPHDCPVCEEGGECHLQDMTEMSGHTTRSYDQTKRTHRNQYLGPFINHEMNRCITCYRCVRYYQDYAGGDDLQMLGSHNQVYFGRHRDGTLENPFSGNLVEVCPTGVFTDKTFSEHFTRKWDLQCAPSICQHCAVGCNTSPGERYGKLKRITNRYHSEINSYFLCDRGRFGYGFVNSKNRIRHVLQRDTSASPQATTHSPQSTKIASSEAALEALSRRINDAKTIAIGSPRASLENNFALRKAVGEKRFYAGFSPVEESLLQTVVNVYRQENVSIPSLKEIEDSDAVLVLGEDILNTAPVLALRVRQAVRSRSKVIAQAANIPTWQDAAVQELAQHEKNPLALITLNTTDLDTLAAVCDQRAPADISRIGFAIAHQLDSNAPAVMDLDDSDAAMVSQIASFLNDAERPLIISGTSLQTTSIIEAAANIARALSQQKDRPCPLHYCLPECNSLGSVLLTSSSPTQTLDDAIKRIESGEIKSVVIMENDLYRRLDSKRLDHALNLVEELIVIDHIWSETAAKADWVLPAANFAETEGTLINSEGRAQRFFAVYPLSNNNDADTKEIKASWQWLSQTRSLNIEQGQACENSEENAEENAWKNIDDLTQACAASSPLLGGIIDAAPGANLRKLGQKIPRMSHRYSGRTAINAHTNVSEPRQTEDSMSALGFTMEGNANQLPPSMRPSTWSPGWNSNQSIHKFQQEINGELSGGPSGIRLLDDNKNQATWFDQIPARFAPETAPETGTLIPAPLFHVFGSEELSNQAAPIVERKPRDYAVLNPLDAESIKVGDGDGITFSTAGKTYCLGVQVVAEFPQGLVGLPMGMSGLSLATLETPLRPEKALDWRPPPTQNDANVFARQSELAEDGEEMR